MSAVAKKRSQGLDKQRARVRTTESVARMFAAAPAEDETVPTLAELRSLAHKALGRGAMAKYLPATKQTAASASRIGYALAFNNKDPGSTIKLPAVSRSLALRQLKAALIAIASVS